MDRNTLLNLLKVNNYAPAIKDNLSMDYLKELGICCIREIPIENYLELYKENSSVENNAEELKRWRESFGKPLEEINRDNNKDANAKGSVNKESEESEDIKNLKNIIEHLYEDLECQNSKCVELTELGRKLHQDLDDVTVEKNKISKELDLYKAEKESLNHEVEKLKSENCELKLSLNENLIAHSAIEKKNYHDVPKCRSDVEFATFLFERERRLTKEQRGFVFECFNRKIPHRIIWQNVSAGYDVGLMRNLVNLAVKEEEEKKKISGKIKHLFTGKEDDHS